MSLPKAIPSGYHNVTPYITVRNAKKALEFYEKAFMAETLSVMPMPDSEKVMHSEMRIGDSVVMVGDEWPEMPDSPRAPDSLGGTITSSLFIYTEDVDKSYKRAVDAGCTSSMEPETMFWGDRFAEVIDPFGHHWQIATHVEDVPPNEMDKRAREAFSKQK